MSILDYRTNNDNGLSFELLVDGQPLGTLVGAKDTSIPYWIIENDLPNVPPQGQPLDPDLRIVAVCSCGEYGCGHTECRVIRGEDSVVFRDFDMDCSREGRMSQFTFSRANYDRVVSEIVKRAQERKARDTRTA